MKRKKRIALIRCSGAGARLPEAAAMRLKGDCASIKDALPEGGSVCLFGCLGGGSCVQVCPFHAITLGDDGGAAVDREACRGCGKCAAACPQQLIELVPPENTIQPLCASRASGKETRKACDSGCIGCGICEKNCPVDAIHVTDGYARIDQARCIACGMCAVRCPRGVIRDANGILAVRWGGEKHV